MITSDDALNYTILCNFIPHFFFMQNPFFPPGAQKPWNYNTNVMSRIQNSPIFIRIRYKCDK